VKLTAAVKAGGCASKLSPALLERVLSRLPRGENPNVLVGYDKADDAGVYKLTDDLAIVQTVDFFTPVVDDPYTFGQIAAANALSDIYAMGGKPISALCVMAYPIDGDTDVLEQIMRGGLDKMNEAGCAIIGGHSVADPEIKFGYAVTGTISPKRILSNAGARAGDSLILTKKLGTGVITTALKRGTASESDVAGAIEGMRTLNRVTSEIALRFRTHAITDVTGFGLMGHGREMALASGVTLEIDSFSLDWLPGALEAAKAGNIPGGLVRNREHASSCVEIKATLSPEMEALLYDPQTSGGLLIAVDAHDSRPLIVVLRDKGVHASLIGRVESGPRPPIRIV
jgi:selenide,water dikinase